MISSLASATCILATGLFYVHVPVVNMRENPTIDSKVVSQTIFSEKIDVEKESDGWSKIVTPDGYTGWVPSKTFVCRDVPYEGTLKISRLAAHIYGVKDTESGPLITLPYDTKLQVLDTDDPRWIKIVLPDGNEGYVQKGDVTQEDLLGKEDLADFSFRFLGLPYTWGGRSSFGYDCSGFVQMLYSKIGIHLKRDSKQQVLDERFRTVSIEDLEIGDLIFFGKSAERIMHVGMCIGQGKFIHATARENQPWIRISNLSDFEWSGHTDAYYPFRIARQLLE